MNALTDISPMPFGKHTGLAMKDVPASYLNWLWNNGQKDNKPGVSAIADYIRSNLDALKRAFPAVWLELQRRYMASGGRLPEDD